ncbi:hypothetical protein BJV78DRAFT_1213478 [Lactifluus subvellereus]|nr:hypothetical protein BJV78DRAFT_1213478 [Lactifluus subvellereus]
MWDFYSKHPGARPHPSALLILSHLWLTGTHLDRLSATLVSSFSAWHRIYLSQIRVLLQPHPRSLWSLPVSASDPPSVLSTCLSSISAGNSASLSNLISPSFPASASFDGHW